MKINKTLLVLFLLLLSFLTIQSQNWNQTGQSLIGDDEDFGRSVSLSADGSMVAIGAPWHYNSANECVGNVGIYGNQNGIWTQIGQDIEGEAAEDGFGVSVDLSSDGNIVAAKDMAFPGHVRIYRNQGGTWVRIGQEIVDEASSTGSAGSTQVVSLSFDGSILAIGSPGNDGNGDRAGHVRIYKNQNDTWLQIGEDIDGEAANDSFGTSVSLCSNGSIVAIGATGNDGNGEDAGHVRIFENQNETWVQVGEDINGEAANDWFGTSVNISSIGSIVAIGAPGNQENGYLSGHVRIYENQNGTWTQIGQDIDGVTDEDYSGQSVCLSSDGRIVTIGAPDHSDYTGQVRVYEYLNGSWTKMGQDIEGEGAGFFGYSVSLNSNGSMVSIGAPWVDRVRLFTFGNTGIYTDISNTQLSIYPNPTDGIFNIDCTHEDVERITFYDITGRQLLINKPTQRNEIFNLASYERGVYTIRIQTKDDMFITKIIKK